MSVDTLFILFRNLHR